MARNKKVRKYMPARVFFYSKKIAQQNIRNNSKNKFSYPLTTNHFTYLQLSEINTKPQFDSRNKNSKNNNNNNSPYITDVRCIREKHIARNNQHNLQWWSYTCNTNLNKTHLTICLLRFVPIPLKFEPPISFHMQHLSPQLLGNAPETRIWPRLQLRPYNMHNAICCFLS